MLSRISQIKAWTNKSKLNKDDAKHLLTKYLKKKDEQDSPLSSPDNVSRTVNGHRGESDVDELTTIKIKQLESESTRESKFTLFSQNPFIPEDESSTPHAMEYLTSHETTNTLSHPTESSTTIVNTVMTPNEPHHTSDISMKTKMEAPKSQVELFSSHTKISDKENKKSSTQICKLAQPTKGTSKSKIQFPSVQNKTINKPNLVKQNLLSIEGNDISSTRGSKRNSLQDKAPQPTPSKRKKYSTNNTAKGLSITSTHSEDKITHTKQSLPRVSVSPKRFPIGKTASLTDKTSKQSKQLITGSLQTKPVSQLISESPSRKSKLLTSQKVLNTSKDVLPNSKKISTYSKEKTINTTKLSESKSTRNNDLPKSSRIISKKSMHPNEGALQPKATTTSFDKAQFSIQNKISNLEKLKSSIVGKKPPKPKTISTNQKTPLSLQSSSSSGHGYSPKLQTEKASSPKKSTLTYKQHLLSKSKSLPSENNRPPPVAKSSTKKKTINVTKSSFSFESPTSRFVKLSTPNLLSAQSPKQIFSQPQNVSHRSNTTNLTRRPSFVSITSSASSPSIVKPALLREQSLRSTKSSSSLSTWNSPFETISIFETISFSISPSSSPDMKTAIFNEQKPSMNNAKTSCLISPFTSEKKTTLSSKNSISSSKTSLSTNKAPLLSDDDMSSHKEKLITLSENILANLESILDTSEGILLPTQNKEVSHREIISHSQIPYPYQSKDLTTTELNCGIDTVISSLSKDHSLSLSSSQNSENNANSCGSLHESDDELSTKSKKMCLRAMKSPAGRLSFTSCFKTISSGEKRESENNKPPFYYHDESPRIQMLKLFASFLILFILSYTSLIMVVNRLSTK